MSSRTHLSADEITAIRHADGSYAQIAVRYGVSKSTVGHIKTGARDPGRRRQPTRDEVEAIRAAHGTHRSIGERYGVSRVTVTLIKGGRTFAEHQALDEAERRRQADRFWHQQFCQAQRKRVAHMLNRHAANIQQAKWGDLGGHDTVFDPHHLLEARR